MLFPKIKVKEKLGVMVISPIYNKIEAINFLNSYVNDFIFVFLGKICYPHDNTNEIIKNLNTLKSFLKSTQSYYVVSDTDLKFTNLNKFKNNEINNWINEQCIGINFTFNNNTTLTVVNGGIPLTAKSWEDINCPDVAYIKAWHKSYDGKFGYVISANPISNKIEYHNFSCSIGVENEIFAQKFDESGVKEPILII